MTQQPPMDVPVNMHRYVLGLLQRGPRYDDGDSPESQELQRAHLAHIRRMTEAGKYLITGPFLDSGDMRGLTVLATDSPEEGAAWMADDPAVQAGRFTVAIHPVFLPALDAVSAVYQNT